MAARQNAGGKWSSGKIAPEANYFTYASSPTRRNLPQTSAVYLLSADLGEPSCDAAALSRNVVGLTADFSARSHKVGTITGHVETLTFDVYGLKFDKFTGDTAKLREAYYIGATIATGTLGQVLTAARNIRSRLVAGANDAPPQDILPGITAAAKIKDLTDAIAFYDAKDKEQGKKQNESSGTLEEIVASIGILAGLRRQIQLAADQAWPWRTAGVVTIRKAFLLPVDRPSGE